MATFGTISVGQYTVVAYDGQGGTEVKCPGCGHWTGGVPRSALEADRMTGRTTSITCACARGEGLPTTPGGPKPTDCGCTAVYELMRSGVGGRFQVARVGDYERKVAAGLIAAPVEAAVALGVFTEGEQEQEVELSPLTEQEREALRAYAQRMTVEADTAPAAPEPEAAPDMPPADGIAKPVRGPGGKFVKRPKPEAKPEAEA